MAMLEAAPDDLGVVAPPTPQARPRRWWHHLSSFGFLAPAGIWLALIVIYPVFATVRYSFFNEAATKFVGLSNYKTLFTSDDLLIAFRNNIIWVVIFPFFVTFLGLVYAVLSERIRWSTAFKAIIVMPIVFSTTASALVWAAIFSDQQPQIGVVNALVQTVSDWFNPPGLYPVNSSAGQTVSALASYGLRPLGSGALESSALVHSGGTTRLGMIGILPATLQTLGATQAHTPTAASGSVSGVVWRDFSPTSSNVTTPQPGEDGLPGLRLSLVSPSGSQVAATTTDSSGAFRFSGVAPGSYRVEVTSSNFGSGFTGINWLGVQSLTPTGSAGQTAQALLSVPLVDMSMIIAYLWIWAGFAMVILAAGLAAIDRAVLEASHVDGATELQTFRKVTAPLLAPVLTVVFV
ncbi:MAG TPA: ABC transporter permease subunit, partial [Acidimicrobiales bacterium]|nr:ABC transporter permease subunit [Acidimicrobiales bacterium]